MPSPDPGMPACSRFRRFGLIGLALLAGAVAGSSRSAAAPKPWLKLEAPGFVIYSDASEKQTTAAALHYAAFRRAFAALFVPPGRTLRSSVLVVFRTNRGFREAVAAPARPGGSFTLTNVSSVVDGTPVNAFSVSDGRDEALERTFEFETTWALRELGYAVPLWASQGAGEVLSTVRLTRGACVVGEPRRSFTNANGWPRFFEIGTLSPEYKDPGQLADYLAQAAGVMHWVLLSDDGGRERFADLATHLHHASGADALAAVMHTPVDQFSRVIDRAVHAGHRLRLPFDEAAVRATFRVNPAAPAEVLVQRSALMEGRGEQAEATLLLNQARELAPDLPMVLEASARRWAQEGRLADARTAWRAAIQAGTKRVSTYVRSAEARLNDSRSGRYDRAGEGGAEADRAIAELYQALALDPQNTAAYALLGRALFVRPKLAPTDPDELAPGLAPGQAGETVRFYRAMVYSRQGRYDEAIADLDHIVADPHVDDDLRATAQRRAALERVNRDLVTGESLLRAHDYAAVRRLTTAGLAGDHVTADARRRYGQLDALADDEEAWDKLKALDDGAHPAALEAAIRAFVDEHPDSRHTNDAYELLMRAAFPDRKPAPPPLH